MKPGRSDYARVERAILFVEAHAHEQPALERIAAEVGLSEFHFQRLFQRWAGVSPKRFLQYLTLQHAKRLLRESRSLLHVSADVGLSGSSRLHDLFLSLEKMTPGEYKQRARGLTLRWAVEPTPCGPALIAMLGESVAAISFLESDDREGEAEALSELRERWPGASLEHQPLAVRGAGAALRARMDGKLDCPLALVLKGTPLQLRVWEALLRVGPGQVAAYGDVARLAGAETASRAVGTAIGQNAIACLIPCHRVLRATGAFGGYRWGTARKAALLAREQALLHAG
jgi:AraC family transcriptional regulator of adaptative response/methylated-DNA-[protein]-cysteine methyltransferase